MPEQRVPGRVVRRDLEGGNQGIEVGIGVTEIVVIARINAEIHRLDVFDDRQLELAATEYLVEPLGPLEVFDVDANADPGKLRCDDLSGAPRVRPRRQSQRDVESVRITGLGQQGPGTLDVVRIAIGQIDIGPALPRVMAADGLAESEQGAVDHGTAIDRVRNRPADAKVVERRRAIVDGHDELAGRRSDDDPELRVVPEFGDVLGRRIVRVRVDVARLHRRVSGRRIADEAENDTADTGGNAPVVRVSRKFDGHTPPPAGKAVRTGANRFVRVGGGTVCINHDGIAPAEEPRQHAGGPAEPQPDGMRIDHVHATDCTEQRFLGIRRIGRQCAIDRKPDGFRIECIAIVETHIPPQVEDIAQAIRRHLPRFGEGRRDFAGLRDPGETLEDVAVDDRVDGSGGA